MPFFRRKKAISKADLSRKLVELSEQSDQFTLVDSPETDFIVERKIVDASGYGIAGVDEMKKTYKAFLLLDEEKHEARYNEETRESSRSLGLSLNEVGFSMEKKFFRGKVLFSKESGKELNFKKRGDPTSFGKIYDYSFDVKKIREPIKKLVEDSGWKFKHVTLKRNATYKK